MAPEYDANPFSTDRENVPLALFKKGTILVGASDGDPSGAVHAENYNPGEVLQVSPDGTTFVVDAVEAGASTLGDLTDVDVSSAVTDDVLAFNGATWVATTPSGGGAVDSVNGQTGVVVVDASEIPFESGAGTNWLTAAETDEQALLALDAIVPYTGAVSDGYVLTADSGAPVWAAPAAGGGGVEVARVAYGSSGVGVADLTGSIGSLPSWITLDTGTDTVELADGTYMLSMDFVLGVSGSVDEAATRINVGLAFSFQTHPVGDVVTTDASGNIIGGISRGSWSKVLTTSSLAPFSFRLDATNISGTLPTFTIAPPPGNHSGGISIIKLA